MLISHGNSADNRSNDSDEALVCAAKIKIIEMRRAVELFLRCTIDGSVIVRCKASDSLWREDICIDHVASEVGNKLGRGLSAQVVPSHLLLSICSFVQLHPATKMGDRCLPYEARLQLPFGVAVKIIVWRAEDTSSHIAKIRFWLMPMEFVRVIEKDNRFIEACFLRLAI